MENASKGMHSNKNTGLSASTFGLPGHSLEDVQAKKKHP